MSESVTYTERVHDTDEAVLFCIEGEKIWVPKSLIEDDDGTDTLELPKWFCEREGII